MSEWRLEITTLACHSDPATAGEESVVNNLKNDASCNENKLLFGDRFLMFLFFFTRHIYFFS